MGDLEGDFLLALGDKCRGDRCPIRFAGMQDRQDVLVCFCGDAEVFECIKGVRSLTLPLCAKDSFCLVWNEWIRWGEDMDVEIGIVGCLGSDEILAPDQLFSRGVKIPFGGHRGGNLVPDDQVVGVLHEQEMAAPMKGILRFEESAGRAGAIGHGIVDLG